MLEEKIRSAKLILAAAATAGLLGLTGCGNDKAEECENLHSRTSALSSGGGYALGIVKVSKEYECPPGCVYDGETETMYCCWCPD